MPRRIDPRLAAGAALALLASAIMVTLPRDGLLAHTAADDALYYLTIARRAGEARWPTFDGLHTTTGFHPLWLFVLVPWAKAVSSPWTLVRVAVTLSSAATLAASLLFGRLFGRTWGASAGVVGAVLLVASPGTARLGWMAMEAPLALLLLAAFLAELLAPRVRAGYLGAFAGLAVLARLDMAIVVAVALGWMVLARRRVPMRAAIGAGAVAAFLVGPYFAWNVALTGHAMTISSATKAYVADDVAMRAHGGRLNVGFMADVARELVRTGGDLAQLSPAAMLAGPIALAGGDHPSAVDAARHKIAIAVLCGVALLLGWALARWSDGRAGAAMTSAGAFDRRADLLIILALASVVHGAMACVLLTRQSGPWYWGLEVITIAAAASYASARWRPARRVASVACGVSVVSMAMLAGALIAGRAGGRFDRRASFASVMLEAGEAGEARREPGEVVGSCNAGALGFFQPGVVNLDGLVNDWALLGARRRGDMRGYLAREKVRQVVDCVPAAALDRYARQLGLEAGDIESKVEIAGPKCVGFVWEIAAPKAIVARR